MVAGQDLRARTGGKLLVQHIRRRQVRAIRSGSTDGEMKMVMIVHVDDTLAHAKDQTAMEGFTAGLGGKF